MMLRFSPRSPEPLNELGRRPRSTRLEYLHNLTRTYVGKYRDPVTGLIDPEADANQFFLGCTLANHDR